MKTTQEHFSKQVTEARQVFLGIPSNETQSIEIVSLGFEKCLPEFLMEQTHILIGKPPKNISQPLKSLPEEKVN